MSRRRGRGRDHELDEIVDVAVRGHDQPAVGEKDRPPLQQAQEHRRLHVVDVVLRSVDRCRPDNDHREARIGVTSQHRSLGQRLEPAVAGRAVVVRRHVFRPREDPTQRLVIGHDRTDVDVRTDAILEQVDEVIDVAATRGHHESRHVEHRVPLRVGERGAHRRDVGAVGDKVAHTGWQRGGCASSVQHGHVVTGIDERGDQTSSDEDRPAEDQRLHVVDGSSLTSILPTLAPDITPNSASTACSRPS